MFKMNLISSNISYYVSMYECAVTQNKLEGKYMKFLLSLTNPRLPIKVKIIIYDYFLILKKYIFSSNISDISQLDI